MKLTKLEIIQETVNFYSENPQLRGMDKYSCVYNGGGGKHCAVGRCLLTKYKRKGLNLKSNTRGISPLLTNYGVRGLDKMLSPKYRGHGLKFWEDLQSFHDSCSNFNFKLSGLTTQGEKVERMLIETYS